MISGKDNVSIVTEVSWEDLPKRCDRLARLYGKPWRRTKFPTTTSMDPIAEPTLVSQLNDEMCTAICLAGHGGFHMSPYDVIVGSDDGYGFTASYDLGPNEPIVELKLSQFITATGFAGPADHAMLRNNT